MKDKKILNISSEVVPYLPQTNQAISSFKIPKNINDHGGQKLLVKVAPNSEVHQWVRYNGIQTPFEVAFYFKLKFIKFESKLSINRLEVNL